eukprot:CAMPEP_0119062972 /NCGR_PEP_ID=MMETSP1178-20130426/6427_1 /TAXON_ID=33656 /ORGANISM="unid sp, Strain CCMP2000" /LENGTH=65 /DNA_ID=CAMNT_0007044293 /DNA_START=148 /DNA_END=345 /DNA_ORIENTATION=+
MPQLWQGLESGGAGDVHGCGGSPPAANLAPVAAWTRHSVCVVRVARGGSWELSRRSDILRRACAL